MTGAAVVAGVGPGFCERLAERLGSEGYAVGLFGRSPDYLEGVAADLREAGYEALAVPTDVTDEAAVAEGFEAVRRELGPVEVLAHTASTATAAAEELDPDRFEELWRLYAYGGLLCAREALPDMREREAGGTLLFFGAPFESGDFAYASGKSAARSLACSLANEYGPEGVHVAHVVVAGGILNPDIYEGDDDVNEEAYMDPEAVAETCWHLIEQDESAWTFELDLRPHVQTDVR
jgi:NAD(P)-dependent dehydrogenase (short-subunit alcohol dehydrogenase family)